MGALEAIEHGLVVSVQAPPGSPLRHPSHMRAIAAAAVDGGARGIRAEGRADVAAINAEVSVPVIGLRKRELSGAVRITPTLEDARAVADAGADLLAVEATDRPLAGGRSSGELLRALVAELALPILADVDSLRAGIAAREAGAAAVATTLSGYTSAPTPAEPDLELVRGLAGELDCPVLAEGRYATAAQVAAAFASGAFAVVVGTAITNPIALTERLAAATPPARTLLADGSPS